MINIYILNYTIKYNVCIFDIIIKMPEVKEKERILKAARKKQLVTYRGAPIRLSADFSKETLQARSDEEKYPNSWKAGNYGQDCSTQQSYQLEWRADKELPRQHKAKGVHHPQAIITWNVKGTNLRKRSSKLWIKWQKYISINSWI